MRAEKFHSEIAQGGPIWEPFWIDESKVAGASLPQAVFFYAGCATLNGRTDTTCANRGAWDQALLRISTQARAEFGILACRKRRFLLAGCDGAIGRQVCSKRQIQP